MEEKVNFDEPENMATSKEDKYIFYSIYENNESHKNNNNNKINIYSGDNSFSLDNNPSYPSLSKLQNSQISQITRLSNNNVDQNKYLSRHNNLGYDGYLNQSSESYNDENPKKILNEQISTNFNIIYMSRDNFTGNVNLNEEVVPKINTLSKKIIIGCEDSDKYFSLEDFKSFEIKEKEEIKDLYNKE